MRFNSHELAALAKEGEYDKSGILQVREKQAGLIRRKETYHDRLFRLRGNLLFYFSTVDVTSEVLGVYVLERCAVELDPEEDKLFSFILVFEGEERLVYLSAHTEAERDSWIACLHIASYECLNLQLESLREQIRSRTGRDPIVSSEPSVEQDLVSSAVRGEPFLEMCVACEGLPVESNGLEPTTFAMMHCLVPSGDAGLIQQWRGHARTETFSRSSNPAYSTTIGFDDPSSVSLSTTVKVTVYDVKERMTNTSTQIGSVEFTLQDVLCSPGCKLRLKLKQKFSYLGFNAADMGSACSSDGLVPRSPDGKNAGTITLLAWTNHEAGPGSESSPKGEKMPALPLKSTTRRVDSLKPRYDNAITKTFRFPTNVGRQIRVHEYMAESKLTYHLPRLLLKLWVEEEKKKIEQLQELGESVGEEIKYYLRENMAFSLDRLSIYTQQERDYINLTGAPFKPSVKKCHKEVEFAPVNLHLHRVWVQSDETTACYDCTTVGAFTAFPHKYKHGGLRRMLRQLRSHITEDADGITRLEKVNLILARIVNVKKAMDGLASAMCDAANKAKAAELNAALQALSDKTHQLVEVCDDKLVSQGMAELAASRLASSRPRSDAVHNRSSSPRNKRHQRVVHSSRPSSTGADRAVRFYEPNMPLSPTEEPWDLSRVNTMAALKDLSTTAENLMADSDKLSCWLNTLSPKVIELQRRASALCDRARDCLNFLSVRECGSNVPLTHTIKYRRDVVLAHALTATVSAFMTKLRGNLQDEIFLRQLVQTGVLVQYECLLSCHGEEMGMLEDHAVGVSDVELAVFQFVETDNSDDVLPMVEGNRSGYIVYIPLHTNLFHLLPKELQRGHRVKVTPVLFTIGIDQNATLAERIGDTSVQEALNEENFHKLYTYYEKYHELFGEPERRGKNSLPLEQLVKQLQVNVMTKKSKNVEVLHLAAEVCRKMSGVRVVSCKSAKDRTGMAVTLECVQLLQKNHDLASHVFHHAVDCLRSEGVRMDNTEKNTGCRKYAFNGIQLLSFPKLYRPPNGTYGNLHT